MGIRAHYKMLFVTVIPHGGVELAHSEIFLFRYLIPLWHEFFLIFV